VAAELDESPEVFNRWVTIRSARVFLGRAPGDSNNFRYTAMDEQQALTGAAAGGA
jgi:hypothetical protein